LQLDYGVATLLYATAMGTFDGQAAHTHGGEEDTDGGVVEIGLGSGLLYSLQDNTIANSSEQTQQTLTTQDMRSVPPNAGTGIGNSANGPQVPRGKDPIVFVPVQAQAPSRTVTPVGQTQQPGSKAAIGTPWHKAICRNIAQKVTMGTAPPPFLGKVVHGAWNINKNFSVHELCGRFDI
jgi:hypothetical protein